VNVGAIRSDENPSEPSNRVVVPLTQVLGVKIVKQLPFTGFDTLQNSLLAAVLICTGLLVVTWPRLQPQSRRTDG
jgi:hypothetical protein